MPARMMPLRSRSPGKKSTTPTAARARVSRRWPLDRACARARPAAKRKNTVGMMPRRVPSNRPSTANRLTSPTSSSPNDTRQGCDAHKRLRVGTERTAVVTSRHSTTASTNHSSLRCSRFTSPVAQLASSRFATP
ncbi:Uncharacterised protein [Mycobacteroides abscessus subsp. abscessus]|nr:Uncharacterised protein [Mycobacteroides abscessus subsp. abscessus]